MPYEMLVGLEVTDDDRYQQYRDAMGPILAEHGGGFRYDFSVAEVLRSASDHAINRVFTIHFADRAAKERFFAHPAYVQAKAAFFESSTGGLTVIAEYDRADDPG